MRELTVTRKKRIIGCLGKMKVYVEDQDGEYLIRDVKCRRLGEIKNGETATFEISAEAVRIFVIADRISKDWCYDCYQLPKSHKAVSLTGRNIFNPLLGNPFCFDGSVDEEILEQRQKNLKKGLMLILLGSILGVVIGFSVMSAIIAVYQSRERVFATGDMSICLNESFTEYTVSGYHAVYGSKNVDVYVSRDPFNHGTETSVDLTPYEYAGVVIAQNRLGFIDVCTEGGLVWFVYDGQVNGTKYQYFAFAYKTDDAYWMVNFAVRESKAKRYADDIMDWADSVEFDK